jgi:hypothetical protein
VYAQPPRWELYTAMMNVADKTMTKADLAEVFRKCAKT